MCGFREPDEIRRLLAAFLETPSASAAAAAVRAGCGPLFQALAPAPQEAPAALRNFLQALFELSPVVREALTEYVLSAADAGDGDGELMRRFARLYPGDPAVIAPLYLHTFHLQPGEAVFLQAGVLHAYIHGFAVELMANSDNVLRGGLTPKYVDVPELMRVLDFSPFRPQLIKPEPGLACFNYPAPCEEFSLTVMRGSGGSSVLPAELCSGGPSICIVSEGEALFPNQGMVLRQGESAFIPPAGSGEDPLTVQGRFTLYAASVPQ
jgi:mannose-6-phosphate isomerase